LCRPKPRRGSTKPTTRSIIRILLTYYSIDQYALEVTILRGDPYLVFVFEAHDTVYDWMLNDINAIKVTTSDPVNIRIACAQNVEEIASCSVLTASAISGNLGTLGQEINVSQLQGPISVAGHVLGDLFATSWSGNLSIGGDVRGAVVLTTGSGNVTVGAGLLSGSTLAVPGACNVTINGSGTHYGSVQVTGPYSGTMWIKGNLGGSIDIAGALNGQIRINGSLFGTIWVDSIHPTTGAIAIDYDGDGWQSGDQWVQGRYVYVGSTQYGGNTASAHVYEITKWKADLNNDGLVNDDDIPAFNTAISDPTGNAYASAYPGLHGSWMFHGDVNCDGYVNSNDSAQFQARVEGHYRTSTCETYATCCFPDGGGCQILTAAACQTAGGVYSENWTTCEPNPCAETGACCSPDGTCDTLGAIACVSQGGVYQGSGTTCASTPCPQPGACCLPTGSCTVVAGWKCMQDGGTALDPETTCDPYPCPEPGACCIPGTMCREVTAAECAQHAGNFGGEGTTCSPNQCPRGEVVAWGDQTDGKCTFPSGVSNEGFIAVAAGYRHSLGLKADATIVAWGSNANGQRDLPPEISNSNFVAIAAGAYFTLGLKGNGSIFAWGSNAYGQCPFPTGIPNTDFVAIAAGDYHGLGLKSDGSIVAWGRNTEGQCNVLSPNADFVAVAAGSFHSLALRSDGSIAAWGDNTHNQCSQTPTDTGSAAVAANLYYSMRLKGGDGSIKAWGTNDHNKFPPEPNSGFAAIAAGAYHCLGLTQAGTITAWGAGQHGQSGDENYNQSDVPAAGTGFKYMSVAASHRHSLAIKEAHGACCYLSTCMDDTTQVYCEAIGGDWRGAASACAATDCLCRGDTNCDGAVDFDDINPFVTAIVDQTTYEAKYPACFWLNGDIDCSGGVDFDDISPFVAHLVTGTCASCGGGSGGDGAGASVGSESAAGADSSGGIEVRIWVTTEPPNTAAGGNIVFRPGYGPRTPYATGSNDSGDYAIHQNAVPDEEIPGSVAEQFWAYDRLSGVCNIPDVVAPTDLAEGTPVYIWAAFCGTVVGNPAPPKPLLGWENAGAKITGVHLVL